MKPADKVIPMQYLKDYRRPGYLVPNTNLTIDLSNPEETKVTSELEINRLQNDENLVLDGNRQLLELDNDSLSINGKKLTREIDYTVDDTSLIIKRSALPADTGIFTLRLTVKIKATNYIDSKGFFQIGDTFCTQCESQSFRNITYFPDRPDVLSIFQTTIIQNKDQYPVLLANGVQTDSLVTQDGKQQITYKHDEPKPCYLFAMVAGHLKARTSEYQYHNGRKVTLQVYASPKDESKTEHAMNSIINALRWYEENYGLIYEQDFLRIVAIDDFTIAAMENPTLILFNARDILADPNVAADADYMRIDRIISHEMFHYWAGHRLPIKNWFNFGFKEGLAVMMEELYSESGAELENQILRVNRVMTRVFNADSKKNVHPILWTEYEDPDEREDFILYEKSAEVFRMLRVIVGDEGMKRGFLKYYEKFDTKKNPGIILDDQTSNFDDFLNVVFTENPNTGINPGDFARWFTHTGAPLLKAEWKFENDTFTLRLEQSGPGPFVIPIRMSLVNLDGSSSPEILLLLKEKSQEFEFKHISRGCIPSLLLGYSAYVKTDFMETSKDSTNKNSSATVTHYFNQSAGDAQYKGYATSDLAALMKSSDSYVSWRSMQDFAMHLLKDAVAKYSQEKMDPNTLFSENNPDFVKFIDALKYAFKAFNDERLATMLALPSLSALIEQYSRLDVDTTSAVHSAFIRNVIKSIEPELLRKSKDWVDMPYKFDQKSSASRKLFNQCFHYLVLLGNNEAIKHCQSRLGPEVNMTEKYAALASLAYLADEESIQKFFDQYKDVPLIFNKWIRAQSMAQHPGVIQAITKISNMREFKLGNVAQVLALWAAFASENHQYFHDASGAGYECLADGVIKVSKKPDLALRLLKFFSTGEKMTDQNRIQLQIKQLRRIAETPGIDETIIKAANVQIEKHNKQVDEGIGLKSLGY